MREVITSLIRLISLYNLNRIGKQMNQLAEIITLMENRKSMYQFLGRIYKREVDQALLEQMSHMQFSKECHSNLAELTMGYQMFENYFKEPKIDVLTELAVDYAAVFLGAGIADGTVAYPYESVYTSPERLIMQDARDQVLAIYRERGLDKDEALDIPEDHVGLELEFMAYLCHEAKEAIVLNDWSAAAVSLQIQKEFLEHHLLNWMSEFCADIQKCAHVDFYKAIGTITHGYLALDMQIIHYLSETMVSSNNEMGIENSAEDAS
jgi:putative dimethyl sulfoxide reductase chaperone